MGGLGRPPPERHGGGSREGMNSYAVRHNGGTIEKIRSRVNIFFQSGYKGSIEEAVREIIDLNEKYEGDYFVCLEGWSDEIKEGGNHKELWFRRMKENGLRVKLALVDGKSVRTGPPPSYAKIRRKIARRTRHIRI